MVQLSLGKKLLLLLVLVLVFTSLAECTLSKKDKKKRSKEKAPKKVKQFCSMINLYTVLRLRMMKLVQSQSVDS